MIRLSMITEKVTGKLSNDAEQGQPFSVRTNQTTRCAVLCAGIFFREDWIPDQTDMSTHDIDIRVSLHGQISLYYLLLLSIVGETILREENQTWHITQYFSSDWPYAIRKTDGMTLQSLSLTLQISDLNINTIIIKSEMKKLSVTQRR